MTIPDREAREVVSEWCNDVFGSPLASLDNADDLLERLALLTAQPATASEDVVERASKVICHSRGYAFCNEHCREGCTGSEATRFDNGSTKTAHALVLASLLRQPEAFPTFRDDLLMQTVMRAYDSYGGRSLVDLARAITEAVLALIERTRAPEAAPDVVDGFNAGRIAPSVEPEFYSYDKSQESVTQTSVDSGVSEREQQFTPLEISMLIHFYAIGTRFENIGAPAQQQALTRFKREGWIMADDSTGTRFRTTDSGDAVVKAICRVPIAPSPDTDARNKGLEEAAKYMESRMSSSSFEAEVNKQAASGIRFLKSPPANGDEVK